MALHIIELNDRNIRVSDEKALLGNSPGFANIAQSTPIFGEEALQQARLHPRQSFNQFWTQLSLDPLVTSNQHFRHQADLAYAHLDSLAALHNINDEAIFAVPSNYNRNQLAILLGLVKQCPFNAVGLVDLSVLHAAQMGTHHNIEGQALFVDIQLHQSVLTVLENNNGQLSRGKIQQIPGTGLLALYDAWANMITDEFINQSRFDPQHNADTEQYVYNQLKQWLADTVNGNEVLLEINNKGSVHQAKVNLGYFEQRSRAIINRISDEIHTLVAPDTSIYVPASMASLPGLTRYLANVVELDDSALCKNGFASLDHIIRAPDALGLITSLPSNYPQKSSANINPSTTPREAEPTLAPSHFLLNHQAYILPPTSLYLDVGINNSLEISPSADTALLTITPQAQGFVLQRNPILQPSIQVNINGTALDTETSIQLGDQISISGSSTTIQFIKVL